jgi:hypothetical protein
MALSATTTPICQQLHCCLGLKPPQNGYLLAVKVLSFLRAVYNKQGAYKAGCGLALAGAGPLLL